MSVFGMGVAATDALFLEFIYPGLTSEIRENTVLVDRFGTDTETCLGKYSVFKALTAAPASARPSSSMSLPTPKQGTYSEFTSYMKRGLYVQLQFDGLAVATGKGKGAVMNVVESEVNAIKIQIANKLNRQYWGDGSGRLAQLYAAVSGSTTVIVDGPNFGQDANEYTNPAMWLDVDQEIDIYSTAGVLEAEAITISSITDNGDGTATLVVSEAITASNNAYIFDHDTYASSHAAGVGVPIGLMGIINTADPYLGITQVYFQGIQRSTNTWAQAQSQNFASEPWSEMLQMKLIQKQERFGRVKAVLTNEVIWRSIYDILRNYRGNSPEKAFWAGTEGLAFYGGRAGKIPIIYDTDCPDNKLFTLDDDQIMICAPTDGGLTFLPGDNGILNRVQGMDAWVAQMIYYYNMATKKPQALGYGYNVKHASA
jgi:hypothetical protein